MGKNGIVTTRCVPKGRLVKKFLYHLPTIRPHGTKVVGFFFQWIMT